MTFIHSTVEHDKLKLNEWEIEMLLNNNRKGVRYRVDCTQGTCGQDIFWCPSLFLQNTDFFFWQIENIYPLHLICIFLCIIEWLKYNNYDKTVYLYEKDIFSICQKRNLWSAKKEEGHQMVSCPHVPVIDCII